MNSSMLLLGLAQLSIAVAAFACLALGMDRHAGQCGLKKFKRYRNRRRAGGWLLLTIDLLIAVYSAGWGLGLVLLTGVLSMAAVLVIGLLTYRPARLTAIAGGNAAVGAVLLGFLLAA